MHKRNEDTPTTTKKGVTTCFQKYANQNRWYWKWNKTCRQHSSECTSYGVWNYQPPQEAVIFSILQVWVFNCDNDRTPSLDKVSLPPVEADESDSSSAFEKKCKGLQEELTERKRYDLTECRLLLFLDYKNNWMKRIMQRNSVWWRKCSFDTTFKVLLAIRWERSKKYPIHSLPIMK